MKTLILGLFLLFFPSIFIKSQNLLTSPRVSPYTYIYKISDKEASRFWDNKPEWKTEITRSVFHTLVDSFPTISNYKGKLSPGNYMKIFVKEDNLEIEPYTVKNAIVNIKNNSTDLCIEVIDFQGKIINNANVKINNRTIRFDKISQTYRIHKSNRKGLLKVKWQGCTQYINLSRNLNNSGVKRFSRKLIYYSPLKYIIRPVYNLVRLPYDAVRSMFYPYRYYNRSWRYFRWGVVNIFDNPKRYSNHSQFFVFNKPIYKPGDTVRFKAYVTDHKGKPYDRLLALYIGNNRSTMDDKFLGGVAPYRAGGFSYEFVLNESLNLKIDKSYWLSLFWDKAFITGGELRIEDYELVKSKFEVRQPSDKHVAGVPFQFFVKGTDDNGLNLLDANLRVIITPGNIYETHENCTFIADTLLDTKLPLATSGETTVVIPDSIFLGRRMDYVVRMVMQTSDYETKEQTITVPYLYQEEDIHSLIDGDSITFSYSLNGTKTGKSGILKGIDGFGNIVFSRQVQFPYSIALDPLINSLEAEAGSSRKITMMSDQDAQILCTSSRENGRISIRIYNPRKLPFTYYLYRNNTQILRGYNTQFEYNQPRHDRNDYYVSLQYLWAGKVQNDEYTIPYRKNHLQVKVKQPQMVIPGQEITIDILVEDADGKPVADADITAMAYTSKFNKPLPLVKDFIFERQPQRRMINTFHEKREAKNIPFAGKDSLYTNWIVPKQMDTIEYFRFAYPLDSIYSYCMPAPDSITQFSPFVTHRGHIEPLQAIYLNEVPVYVANDKLNIEPYSFPARGGINTITLRTSTKLIQIRKAYLKPGYKTIFSISDEANLSNVSIKEMEHSRFSDEEKKYLLNFLMPYRNKFPNTIAYLKQRDNVYLLSHDLNINTTDATIAGPLRLDEFDFKQIDKGGWKMVFEPGFEYEFLPSLIKMRSFDKKNQPELNFVYPGSIRLSDSVLTENNILAMWEKLKLMQIASYYGFPSKTAFPSDQTGNLILLYQGELEFPGVKPLFQILFRRGDPGYCSIQHAGINSTRKLDPGYYDVISIFPGFRYMKNDSVEIRSRQTTVLNANNLAEILPADSLSRKLCAIIYDEMIAANSYSRDKKRDYQYLERTYASFMQFPGEGRFITGSVKTADDKEPIPGVTVLIKGTSNGTLTDLDGNFRIKVPFGITELQFSFIGMETQVIEAGTINQLEIFLKSNSVEIQGVVVKAYKMPMTDKDKTVSGATVTSEEIVSVRVRGSASLAGVLAMGSGNRSEPGVSNQNRENLIVVDGTVFYGNWSDFDKSQIHHTEELSGELAVAQFGEKAVNGALLVITHKGFARNDKGASFDDAFAEAARNTVSLRTNFSDYAYWQPKLRTNNQGIASFSAKFPDDITSWQTTAIAVSDKRKTGQANSTVKAYKPLSAQIAMPRFLVEGDSLYALGKVINYDAETIKGNSELKINGITKFSHSIACTDVVIDTLPFVAPTSDSVNIIYSFRSDKGYFDGESRNLEIIPMGADLNKGQFFVLSSDTMVISPVFESGTDSVVINIDISELAVLMDEAEKVIKYVHDCNEQMASKLKALISRKYIQQLKEEPYDQDKEINKLIGLLQQNQNDDGMWGWWNKSTTSLWISRHVIEALSSAQKAGYKVNYKSYLTSQYLILHASDVLKKDYFIIAKMLSLNSGLVDLRDVVEKLENRKSPSVTEQMFILELRQSLGLSYNLDSLVRSFDTTLYGNLYVPNTYSYYYTYDNVTSATLIAYRIIRNSDKYPQVLPLLRNYFFETRRAGTWMNTYESISIIETILPDLEQGAYSKNEVFLIGDITRYIETFPYKIKVKPDARFTMHKTGNTPVYISTYQRIKVKTPVAKTDYFKVTTEFPEGLKGKNLVAGQKVTFQVRVDVKKTADYVMIEVPIPAGCSYDIKAKSNYHEAHREYYRNQVNIYMNNLRKGFYTFEIELMPRYTGSFTINPAKVEPMYLPLMYGNDEVRKVRIVPDSK